MAVNLVDPVTPGTSTTYSTQKDRSLSKQDFLNLLVAQLKNQDPLNPMEGTDFTAQLAQFSSLEQLFDVNENLNKLAEQRQSLGNMEALGLVGKRVKAVGDTLSLAAEGQAEGRYSLEEMAKVEVAIYDSNGKLVRTLEPGWQEAGGYDLAWDGLNESGSRCSEGTYVFRAQATGLTGEKVPVVTYSLGTVTGVKLNGTEPSLVIGGADGGSTEIALSDLTEILN
jgi:flagellar basal-body rod modification protein FlgD